MCKLRLLASLLLLAVSAVAQTTTVTVTVVDPNAQAFSNGTYDITLNGNGKDPSVYRINGAPFTQHFSGALDGAGSVTIALTDNSLAQPLGSQWYFRMCADAEVQCTTVSLPVAGATQNLSAAFNAHVLSIGILLEPVRPFMRAYLDAEVLNPAKGSVYYNTTTLTPRKFDGIAWSDFGGGGGGGGTVVSFGSSDLSPLFTTTITNPTTTPFQTFNLSDAPAHTVFGNYSGVAAAPDYQPFTFSGNTTTAASSSGPLVPLDCVMIDANGNYVDGGNPCASSSGAVTPCASGSGSNAFYPSPGIILNCDNLMIDDGSGQMTGNIFATRDTNGGIAATEGTGAALTAATGVDLLFARATNHWWYMNNNNTGIEPVAGIQGAVTPGNCVQFASVTEIQDTGSPCGGGGGGGSVTTFSSGNASPLFTTNVANPTTTPALTFTVSSAAAQTYLGNATTGSAAPTYVANNVTCMMSFGADNAASVLVTADIAPQTKQCQFPYAATVQEIDVTADGGTSNVIVAKRHCTASPCASNYTVTDLVSAALATAGSGGPGCSKTGATTGIDGFTTCVATLQNTTIAVGDWIETRTASADGVAKAFHIAVRLTH